MLDDSLAHMQDPAMLQGTVQVGAASVPTVPMVLVSYRWGLESKWDPSMTPGSP